MENADGEESAIVVDAGPPLVKSVGNRKIL